MKKIKSVIFKFILLFFVFVLTGCDGEKTYNFIPNFSNLNGKKFFQPLPQNKLRYGLFNLKDNAPLGERELEFEKVTTPQALWTRMRTGFKLNYAESNPKIQKFIREYSKNSDYVNRLSHNASPYLFFIVEELVKRNLPLEIALLPMIESDFNPFALSEKGAHGMWQIMPGTAKILGLKQDAWYDGRRDITASTRAALNHLQYLNRTFQGDWFLTLAAYNAGERRIIRAIENNKNHQKPTDYWHLKLPQQTLEYVPKLLAFVSIVKNPTKYGVQLPSIANQPYLQTIDLDQQIDLKLVAHLSNTPLKEIKRLNPALQQHKTPPSGPHRIVVPIAIADHFQKIIKKTDPTVLANLKSYEIKDGDDLIKIAALFNADVEKIKELNHLISNKIDSGQTLFIPPDTKVKIS
ncbi:MAG TPA: transglycosylase SLT domain-containing protein [Gammaproteobacteria bacterium]|nr:transglycosylase SLT domain-containing protein [Gammaproteobacteria bacterium]